MIPFIASIEWPKPYTLSFIDNGRKFVGKIDDRSRCKRCRKSFGDVTDMHVVVTKKRTPPATKHKQAWLEITGKVYDYKIALYHARCVPPNVFHAAAGSRPAPGRSRVAPADASVSPPRAARIGVSGPAIIECA